MVGAGEGPVVARGAGNSARGRIWSNGSVAAEGTSTEATACVAGAGASARTNAAGGRALLAQPDTTNAIKTTANATFPQPRRGERP